MSGDSYNERSPDAMFSRILQRMDQQDAALGRIETGVAKTNGRVNSLERWRDVVNAKVGVIALGVSGAVTVAGWLVSHLFK